jgi:hypothetical protein
LLQNSEMLDRPPLAPALRKTLVERQKDQPPEAVAIEWTAQRRLHRTWTRLEARKKRRS